MYVGAYSTNFTIYYRTTRISLYMLADCATTITYVRANGRFNITMRFL